MIFWPFSDILQKRYEKGCGLIYRTDNTLWFRVPKYFASKKEGEPNIHQQKSRGNEWARGALFAAGGNGTTFVFCTSE